MPVYEYRCNSCKRKVTLSYKTYAEYDAATPTCSYCGSTDLTRLISRVAFKRSSVVSRMMASADDDSASFDDFDFDENDPRQMGRLLREMSDEMGEDMGPEFDEVVTRLERGEDPEAIESSLPDVPEEGDPGGGPALPDDSF